MRLHAIRLTAGDDLKEAISNFVISQKLNSVVVLSSVGSLSKARLRMAGAEAGSQDIREFEGPFEIVSMTGTIAKEGSPHLHMSISDDQGRVIGGHLAKGNVVHTTVELVVASEDGLEFSRQVDETTGFDELVIKAQS